jgi:hypothetical protein
LLVATLQCFPDLPSPFRSPSRAEAQESVRKTTIVAVNPPDFTTPADDGLESPFSGSVLSEPDDVIPGPPAPLADVDSASTNIALPQDFDTDGDLVPLPPVDDIESEAPAQLQAELRRLEERLRELEHQLESSTATRNEQDSTEASRLEQLLRQLQAQSQELKSAGERIEQMEQRQTAALSPESTIPTQISIRSVEKDGQSAWIIQARDASLSELLARLGEATGINLLVAPEVAGTVSLHLSEPDAEAALEVVCKLHRCRAQRDGNFVVIQPDRAAELNAQPEPPETMSKLYRLKHLSGGELRPYVQPLLTPGLGTFGFASIRERVARATYRDPPRAILVKDTPRVIAEIDRLILELDRPRKDGMELPRPGAPLPERMEPRPLPTSAVRLQELFEPPVTSENPIYSLP